MESTLPVSTTLVTLLDQSPFADISQLYQTLPFLDVSIRKALLTCIRVQATPPHPRLKSLPALAKVVTITGSPTRQLSVLDDVIPLIRQATQSPLLSGFVSMLLRTTRYLDEQCLTDELYTGLWKEVHATQGDDRPQALSYESLFSSHPQIDLRLSPFHRITTPDVYRRLKQWKWNLRDELFIPEVSDKTVGWESRRQYLLHQRIPLDRLSHLPITTADVARVYEEDGALSPGPVEVRYAFFFTDLKPRIYYALGPDAWYSSQYIWKVSDSLQRVFRTTDPATRYMAHRINPLESNQLLFIFDYTSFTSNMAELKYFLYHLATFCEDVPVRILDLHSGITPTTLGAIIHSYNNSINVDHPFDLGPILGMKDDPLILCSRLSGLLGIFGNIVFSTTLAGINLMCLLGGEDEANTVGDDSEGKVDEAPGRWKEVREGVTQIGDVEESKFETFRYREPGNERQDSWHYLKRPFKRNGNIVETGYMIDWPMISLVEDCTSSVHTEKFEDLIFRRRKFIVQTSRFLTVLETIPESLVDFDTDFAFTYLQWAFKRLNVPRDGRLPGHTVKGAEHLAIPCVLEASAVGWIAYLAQQKSHKGAVLREPQKVAETIVDGFSLACGDVFISRGDAGLGLAQRMGVIESKPLWESNYYPEVTEFQLKDYVLATSRPLYEHVVIREPPLWFRHMSIERDSRSTDE
jgi:hypothetical protein